MKTKEKNTTKVVDATNVLSVSNFGFTPISDKKEADKLFKDELKGFAGLIGDFKFWQNVIWLQYRNNEKLRALFAYNSGALKINETDTEKEIELKVKKAFLSALKRKEKHQTIDGVICSQKSIKFGSEKLNYYIKKERYDGKQVFKLLFGKSTEVINVEISTPEATAEKLYLAISNKYTETLQTYNSTFASYEVANNALKSFDAKSEKQKASKLKKAEKTAKLKEISEKVLMLTEAKNNLYSQLETDKNSVQIWRFKNAIAVVEYQKQFSENSYIVGDMLIEAEKTVKEYMLLKNSLGDDSDNGKKLIATV